MTLPSNSSMKVFPDNTLTTYNTLLPEYVTSSTPMECALQEVTCPTSWYNVEPETLLFIEGERDINIPKSVMSPKRLQDALRKRRSDFFQNRGNDPVLSRTSSSLRDSLLKHCMQRGVQVNRRKTTPRPTTTPTPTPTPTPAPTTESETTDSEREGTTPPPVAPSGVNGVTYNIEGGGNAELFDVSFGESAAVSAVRESLKLNYTEEAAFINGAPNSELVALTMEELTTVKAELKLKYLDKLVNTFQFPGARKYTAFSVQGVYLQDNADLINYLNKSVNRKHPSVIRNLRNHLKNNKAHIFTYNRYTMKCIVALPPDVILQLPSNLGLQLGFGGGVFLSSKTESEAVVDLKFRAQTVYVYSDIVKHNIVGDKRAPLLRVVNINPLLGDTQTVTFQPLIYQPVSKSSFRQIAIYLRDSTGRPIPFERGAVTVVLAFKPISNLIQ